MGAALDQRAALEQQAAALVLEYQQRKMQEEFAVTQAEMHRQFAENQAKLQSEAQRFYEHEAATQLPPAVQPAGTYHHTSRQYVQPAAATVSHVSHAFPSASAPYHMVQSPSVHTLVPAQGISNGCYTVQSLAQVPPTTVVQPATPAHTTYVQAPSPGHVMQVAP